MVVKLGKMFTGSITPPHRDQIFDTNADALFVYGSGPSFYFHIILSLLLKSEDQCYCN